jgi:cytochrome b561
VSATVSQRYSRPAIILHWMVSVLIFTNIALALSADWLPEAWQRPDINLHKSIGITVLGLAIMRLLWRLGHKPPPLLPSRPWERHAAHAAHFVLYLLIFLMPLSGWLHDSAWEKAAQHPLWLYGVIPWFRIGLVQGYDLNTQKYLHGLFGQIHTSLAYVIYDMVAVHVAGALKHQFVDREPEIQRMLP